MFGTCFPRFSIFLHSISNNCNDAKVLKHGYIQMIWWMTAMEKTEVETECTFISVEKGNKVLFSGMLKKTITFQKDLRKTNAPKE